MISMKTKRYLKPYLKCIFNPVRRLMISDFVLGLMRVYSVEEYNKCKSKIFTYHIRPKQMNYKTTQFAPKVANIVNDVGIIIQGGLKYEDDFTIETLKYYRRLYEDIKIVLSTWEDVDPEIIASIEELNIHVITSKKPKIFGFGNNNLQIISTQAGIKFLEDLGCKYIMKSRTDQRIYKEGFIEYFISLLKIYPISDDIKLQQDRIITLNIGTCIDIPFMISDMLQFGRIEDVEKKCG